MDDLKDKPDRGKRNLRERREICGAAEESLMTPGRLEDTGRPAELRPLHSVSAGGGG